MGDPTVSDIIEHKLIKKIAERPDLSEKIDGLYQFVITGDNGGQWILDFRGKSFKLSKGSCESPDCIFTTSDVNLIHVFTGKINPVVAFLTGKIKFTNLQYASKLKPFFTD